MSKVRKVPTMYNHWNPPPIRMDRGGGKVLVETSGYIPPKNQIEQMIYAGQRLNEWRAQQFDFPDGNDDGSDDPTRRRGFDLADASILSKQAESNLEATKREFEKAREEADKSANVGAVDKASSDAVVSQEMMPVKESERL